MKHSSKRWLALLLAVMMMTSLVPVSAYATGETGAEHSHEWSEWKTENEPGCT